MFERFHTPSTDIQVGDLCVIVDALTTRYPELHQAFCVITDDLHFRMDSHDWFFGVDTDCSDEVFDIRHDILRKVPPHGIDFAKLRSRPKPVEVET